MIRKVKLNRKKPHPFDKWVEKMRPLKKDEYLELRKGVDFDCSVRSFQEQIWRFARRNNLSIEAVVLDESVCIRLNK